MKGTHALLYVVHTKVPFMTPLELHKPSLKHSGIQPVLWPAHHAHIMLSGSTHRCHQSNSKSCSPYSHHRPAFDRHLTPNLKITVRNSQTFHSLANSREGCHDSSPPLILLSEVLTDQTCPLLTLAPFRQGHALSMGLNTRTRPPTCQHHCQCNHHYCRCNHHKRHCQHHHHTPRRKGSMWGDMTRQGVPPALQMPECLQ